MSISKILYQTLCVFSQIKDRKHIEQNLIMLPRSCPGVGLRGAGGVKNFSVGICDGTPSTTRSSLLYVMGGDMLLLSGHFLNCNRRPYSNNCQRYDAYCVKWALCLSDNPMTL